MVERAGRMLGLDADVTLAERQLARDSLLGPLVAARPGLRVPGAWGPFEIGVHAIVSQELDLDNTRRALGAMVGACGAPVAGLAHGLTHAFPSADIVATADLDVLRTRYGSTAA